jgi:hypothetical protein
VIGSNEQLGIMRELGAAIALVDAEIDEIRSTARTRTSATGDRHIASLSRIRARLSAALILAGEDAS